MRKLSQMEFYKNARKIRRELTRWMLSDFGYARNPKRIEQVIKDISEEDQRIVDEVFQKYGKNYSHESAYPQWFVDYEKELMVKLLQELMDNIVRANQIKAYYLAEWDLRRDYQDKAIGTCFSLYQELDYIKESFGNGTDMNKFVPILEAIEMEIDLLRGWRQSDNKPRKETEDKERRKLAKEMFKVIPKEELLSVFKEELKISG